MTTVRPPSKTMEKFGLQTEKSAKVFLYRNGDKYHVEGVSVTLHPSKFRTFDQVKTELSKRVGLYTGNVQKVYSMDKKRIQDIHDFVDGHHYICCGAEPLNCENVPKGIQDIFGKPEGDSSNGSHTTPTITSPIKPATPTITSPSVSSTTPSSSSSSSSSSTSTTTTTTTTVTPTRKDSDSSKRPVVSAYKEGAVHSIDKFSVQTEKAKVIMCFRNGDKYHSGERVTVHSSKFKTYDQLKEQLSKQVKLPTGPVRKVFNPIDGKQIKNMEDLIDGEFYVCAAGEGLNLDFSPSLSEHIKKHKQQAQQAQQQASESQKPQQEEMF